MANTAINQIDIVKGTNTTNYLIEPTLLGTCSTAASTAIKDVTLSKFELFNNVQIAVKFTTTNTAAVSGLKLRVNSNNANDAKPIKYRGGDLPAAGTLATDHIYNFVYDGINWELVGDLDTNADRLVEQGVTSTGSWRKLLLSGGNVYSAKGATPAARTDVTYQAANLDFQPSTGTLVATKFSGDGSALTSLTATNITGTVPFGNLPTGTGADKVAIGNHNHDGVYAPTAHTHHSDNTLMHGYTRSQIGTSPNYDNPQYDNKKINGIYEIRASSEVSGETGTRPAVGFYPMLSLQAENVMMQFGGINSQGWFIRGKQAANVTLTDVAWQKLITDANYKSYAWARPSTITDGQVLVSSGTAGETTLRAILNNTTASALGWNSAGNSNANNLRLVNVNTIAYWNGAYSGTSSNLAYYKGGAFGTMAKETAEDYAKLASPTFTGTPKAPTAANGTNTTQIATTEFVNNTLAYANAMTFKGTLGTGGTVTALPDTHNAGDTYRVIKAGTYAGKYCEVGTLIICVKDGTAAADADWTSVETNEDGAVIGPTSSTANSLAFFNSTSGRVLDNTGVYVKYLNHVAANAGTNKVGYIDGIHITGAAYGEAANLISNTAGLMSYGDAGPQIRFTCSGQNGAIIFNHYDNTTPGSTFASSFNFVTDQTNGVALKANAFVIHGANTYLSNNALAFAQGGGWAMSDSTWIRTVGGKSVYMNTGTFRNDGTTQLRLLLHVNPNIVTDGTWETGGTGTDNSGDNYATRGTLGTSVLSIGNAIARPAAGTAGGKNNSKGYLRIYGEGTGYGELSYNDSMFAFNKSIYLTNTTNSGISNEIRGTTATNDFWRVAGGATASNAGYMEIATGDDYNEPIYVRQYSGAFVTVKRTATLLDASGHTEFPVQVTAPKFIGALDGNADTATNISSKLPTLAIATENNEIKVIDLGNSAPEAGLAQRHAIDFRWYDSHWAIGNLRSGSTPSAGFGFSYSVDGTTYSNVAIISNEGEISATTGFKGDYLTLHRDANAQTGKGIDFVAGTTKYGHIGMNTGNMLGIYASSIVIRPSLTATNRGMKIEASAITPGETNQIDLGASNNVWKNVYATTFNGDLSGNATTATSSKVLANQNGTYGTATTVNDRITDTNIAHVNNGGVTHFKVGTATNGPAGGGNILHFYWDTSDAWDAQLHIPNNSANSMSWRASSAAGTWDSWRTVLDSNNYSSYVLPLSGGTMSGSLKFVAGSQMYNNKNIKWINSADTTDYAYIGTSTAGNIGIIAKSMIVLSANSSASAYKGDLNSSIRINGNSLFSNTNNDYSLGTSDSRWKNIYSQTAIYVGSKSYTAYNSDETGTYIEPGGIGLSNKTAQRGYYLRGGTTQYARMFIHTIGTASTAESSSGADDGTQGALGVTILELGNNIARGAKNTTDGAHNARGMLRLYGTNTAFTQVVSNLGGTTNYNFWLPNYAGDAYAVHTSSAAATGGTNRPVYIAANGRATQTTYAMAGTNTVATTSVSYNNDLDTGIWYVNGITGADKTKLYNQVDGVIIANKYNNSWITEIFQDYRSGRLAVRGKTTSGWTDWTRILDENGGTITGDLELISGYTGITSTANKRVQWRTSGSSSEVTGYITVSSPDSGRAKLGIHATGDLFFRPGDANNAISTDTGTVMTNTSFYPNSTVALMSLGIATRPWNGIYSKGGTFSDDIVSNTDLTNTIGTLTTRWGGIHSGYLQLSGPASDPSSSSGARIIFSYDGSATSHNNQPVVLAYTPNDSYRAPYGLKLFGTDGNTSGAWLEVQGNIYAAAFKGNADTATTASFIGKGSHTAAITANEFALATGTLTVLGNVSNTSMPDKTNNANAEVIVKAHPTSETNYYEARLGFNSNGHLYHMPVNGNSWKTILDSSNYSSYALPKSGGTMTGALNLANNTWNQVGDDVYFGDINKGGHIGIQGKNGNTGIFFTTYNQTTKTTGAALTWDGTNMTFDKAVKLPADPQNALEAATKQYVDNSFAANDAMVYKGVLNKDATETATSLKNVPASGYSAGWTYKVAVAGTYANVSCEVGDMVIAVTDAAANQSAVNNAHWTVVQSNLVGAVVATSGESGYIAKFSGANTITKGPKIGSSTTTWLNEKGEWSTPTAANVGAVAKTAGVTAVTWDATNKKLTRTINGTAADVMTATQMSTALGLGTIASKAELDYVQFAKISSGISSNSTAAGTKAYWANNTYIPKNSIKMIYNSQGTEYTLLFSNNNNNYGTVLKWGYADKYLRILRYHYNNGTETDKWYSADWEKISAGYADSANSATTATTATNLADAPTITKTGTSTIDLTAATTYTLTVGGKTVVFKTPADSNTHAATKLIAGGSSATANAAVSSGNVYLRLFDDSTHRSNIQLKAGTAMAITSDANGVITFTSSDTNNAATHTLAKTTKYYVTGTTSATTSTSGDSFDTGVYVTAVEGELSAVRHSYNVGGTEKAYTYYNTSDDSIDFVFVA